MAIGAKEHALRGLLTNGGQRSCEPTVADSELFGSGVAMVKLKRADVPVVTADAAATAGLRYEDLLEATAALRHGRRPALQAPVDAALVEPEICMPVARAVE